MTIRRVLPSDREGPRFRITRLVRIGETLKAEVIGSAESPWEAMQRAFNEVERTVAVDRRGDIYADNHQPIQERVS